MKFNEFVNAYDFDNKGTFKLNKAGQELLQEYHKLFDILKNWIQEDAVVNFVASVSSEQKGTKLFKLANRLDTMTNNGKTDIDKSKFDFHQDDEILDYLE